MCIRDRYVDENTILGQTEDADRAYVEQILPDKIQYNMKYINHRSVKEYFKIIFMRMPDARFFTLRSSSHTW